MMGFATARGGRKATCSRILSSLLCLLLLMMILLPTPSIATKLCQTFQPIKRKNPLTPTTMAAVVVDGAFPRGGATKKVSVGTSSSSSMIIISPTDVLQTFLKTIFDARSHLAAAAAARGISIFSMYPVDTIKTRMQMKQGNAFRLDGLYKGVTGSLVGQVPYGILTFGSYEIYKQALLNKFPNTKPALIYALSAILGDVTGSGWLCPSEVMKQQLQAGIYPSMSEAIKGIWNKSGFGGFYQGFTGGLARDVPFRVAQLTTFEVTKSLYLKAKRGKSSQKSGRVNDDATTSSLSAVEAAICGAAAGSFSAAITNPLDRIKTLMMTDTKNAYGGSVVACASKILKDEGIGGLFAGVVPRVGYIAPSVCIFFVTYEFVQQKMKKKE